jgi:hypothetical protein
MRGAEEGPRRAPGEPRAGAALARGRGMGRAQERRGGEERERGRGELTSGSKSGDHRLQNLGHHGGEREVEERRLLRGKIK